MNQNKKLIGVSLATSAALIFSSAPMTSALAATTTTTTTTTNTVPAPVPAAAPAPEAMPAPAAQAAVATPPTTMQAASVSPHPAQAVPTVRTIIKSIINRHDSLMQLGKPGNVRCFGLNGCRGLGSCRTTAHACKGQNVCNGKGFIIISAKDCKNAAGTTEEPREEKISLVNQPVR